MALQENIDMITIGAKTQIIDNLDSTRIDAALSANMGKKIKDEKYQISYKNIGSSTSTDILAFALSNPSGYYRNISESNVFTNLPEKLSSKLFTLEIHEISDTNKQVIIKPNNSNDIWLSVYVNNAWSKWELLGTSSAYEAFGNETTSIDILDFAETIGLGNYASINPSNKFTSLPDNQETGIFELNITGIDENQAYRTIKFKYANTNDIYINTFTDKWLGWVKILNSKSLEVKSYKGTITTLEEFNQINLLENGIYFIENFNTIFPNNGIKPQVDDKGILDVNSDTLETSMILYRPLNIETPIIVSYFKKSTQQLDTWSIYHNYIIQNKGNIDMYGEGNSRNNRINFHNYEDGTTKYSIVDDHNHSVNPGLTLENSVAGTAVSLLDDKRLVIWDGTYTKPLKSNPYFGFTGIYGMGAHLTNADNIDELVKTSDGGVVRHFFDAVSGETKPLGKVPNLNTNGILTTYTHNNLYGFQTAFDLHNDNVFVRSIAGADPRNWSQLFSTSNCTITHLGAWAGCAYFPNGLKLQWGAVEITPDATSYDFYGNYHIPFVSSSACFCTRSYSNHVPSGLDYVCWTQGRGGYRIYINTQTLNSRDIYWWFAIGF